MILALLLSCGGSPEAPPAFAPWVREAVERCHPGAPVAVQCDADSCIAIVRTPTGEELKVDDCLAWPYNGKGTQKRTQVCGTESYRLTALSQLPELEVESAKAALKDQAVRVAAALDAMPCPG